MIGWIGAALLAILPGAWFAFSPRTATHRPLTRFALAVTFSPIVVAAEFIALRLLGVDASTVSATLPPAATAWAVPAWLVAMNAPAAVLIWLRFRRPASLDASASPLRDRGGALAAFAIIGVITLASFGPRLTDEEDRAFSGHAWMHADTCYQIAHGSIDPEESLLAGVRQTVPWVGHVWPAMASLLIDRPPVVTYFWFNLLWLLAVAVLIAATARNLSPRPMVGPIAVVLLFFGVNVVGYWAAKILPASIVDAAPVFGDPRYTPWLLKYAFFNQMPFAFAAIAAAAYLTTREPTRGDSLLAAVALITVAFIYPLLAPVAGLLLAGRAVEFFRSPDRRRTGLALAATVLLIAIAAYLHLRFLTADRVSSPLDLSTAKALLRKSGDVVFVFALLVAGCWLGRKESRGTALPLLLVAAAAIALYVALHLPGWRNEYKFVFGAALCLAPVAAVGIAPLLARAGRQRFLALALFTALLASPMAMKTFGHPEWGPRPRPRIDTSEFALRLDGPLDVVLNIIRRLPPDTIIIAPDLGFHLPTLIQRSIHYPVGPETHALDDTDGPTPPFGRGHPGLNLEGSYLVFRVRGHDREQYLARKHWSTLLTYARQIGLRRELLIPVLFHESARKTRIERYGPRPIVLLYPRPDDWPERPEGFQWWPEGYELYQISDYVLEVLNWLGPSEM